MLSSDSWTFSPVTNHTTGVETLGRRQGHLLSFLPGLGKEKGQVGSLRTTPPRQTASGKTVESAVVKDFFPHRLSL